MEKAISWFVGHLPTSLQRLYHKYEDLILYVFFGGLTTVVSFAAQFVPAYFLGTGPIATIFCTTFSWIAAVTFAFFTNKKYVFRAETHTKREYLRQFFLFYAARGATYFLELGIMLVFATYLVWNYYLVKIFAQIFIILGNYIFSKLVVFRKKK